ncbi:hypothetical protein L1987_14904 [Smallanthus sonchifolius]|uniref:Uncharacterized protein n=1 Tax=Smallanthus sonchifolius TaxID=185202 RepID=A0ACB9J460_9ASTR|nr:hypothetical protein L1987_14904 [Smallanthus sonchifolius]
MLKRSSRSGGRREQRQRRRRRLGGVAALKIWNKNCGQNRWKMAMVVEMADLYVMEIKEEDGDDDGGSRWNYSTSSTIQLLTALA